MISQMLGLWKGRITVVVLLVIVTATVMMTGPMTATAYPRLRRTAPVTAHTNERPDLCVSDAVYIRCFMCGRQADDVRIYRECCRGTPEVDRFCDEMLL